MSKQKYDLENRLLEYSAKIIKLVDKLPKSRTGNLVAGQLLRSGTSAYPNMDNPGQPSHQEISFTHKEYL